MTKVHTSALVIIPPEDLWEPIQEIRRTKDKAFNRWPPHVNLLYPFVSSDKFPDAELRIKSALSYVQSFTLTLNKLGHFEHGRQSTLYLEASCTEVNELQSLLFSIFPECDDLTKLSTSGFHGHLTLGQFPTSSIKQTIQESSSNWKPITFSVDSIQIISRSNNGKDPFKVVHTIPLKQDIREEWNHTEATEWESSVVEDGKKEEEYNNKEEGNEDWTKGEYEWEVEDSNGVWGEYPENYDLSEYKGKDLSIPEYAQQLISKLTSGKPKTLPRKHCKPHNNTKKLVLERTCKECNEPIFKFDPSAMKQDKFFKLKELIAIHKHKYSVHDIEKSLFALVDVSVQFAKVYHRRRSEKQFELLLQWVKSEEWKYYEQYLNLLTNRLRQEQRTSKNAREKAVLIQSWKNKEKEQNEKGVPI